MSDLHLGLEIKPFTTDRERLATLSNAAEEASRGDILLIAGELFDACGFHLIGEVNEILSGLRSRGVRVVACPGEGELENGAPRKEFMELSCDHIFSEENGEKYVFENNGEKITIHSARLNDGTDCSKIAKSGDGLHIGLFHYDIEPHMASETDLKSFFRPMQLDFYALGGNHRVKLFKSGSRIIGACAGSAHASCEKETGDRYILSMQCENSQVTDVKRVAVNSVRYDDITINMEIEGADPASEIKQRCCACGVMHVLVEGCREIRFNEADIMQYADRYLSLTLNDSSYPSLELLYKMYCLEDSLKGEFVRTLKKRDEAGEIDAAERKELANTLGKVMKSGSTFSEDWLCTLLNA